MYNKCQSIIWLSKLPATLMPKCMSDMKTLACTFMYTDRLSSHESRGGCLVTNKELKQGFFYQEAHFFT